MAEGTYEFECMRAELLGIEKPDRTQFEEARAERLKAEEEAKLAEQANELESNDETINRTQGKLEELNSILSSTQEKINRFKKSACGSLSNIFHRPSLDIPSTSEIIEDKDTGTEKPNRDINSALDDLEQIKTTNLQSDVQIAKKTTLDIQKKMTSHLDKLDSLINKADNAELAMAAQTQQMKKFTK